MLARMSEGKLHYLIFVGMGFGVLVGLLCAGVGLDTSFSQASIWLFDLIGKTLFVGALKMLVAPLIFFSIIAGITSLPSGKELREIGLKTVGFYLCTTSLAALIGLGLVNLVQPGKWSSSQRISEQRALHLAQMKDELLIQDVAERQKWQQTLSGEDFERAAKEQEQSFQLRYLNEIQAQETTALLSQGELGARYEKIQERKTSPLSFLTDLLSSMIQNPFWALSFNSSLGIIFFAILFGLACQSVGAPASGLAQGVQAINLVIMRITAWVMSLSPLAVFCLMASLVANHGVSVFQTLAGYIFTVVLGIGLHVGLLLGICKIWGSLSPLAFLKGIKEAWLIAFSTRSSAATLPVTMRCVEQNLGVSKKVSQFVLPVGATINMDGTALYEGVAVIFLIQMFGGMPDVGIELGVVAMFLIFITAVFGFCRCCCCFLMLA